MKKSNFSIKDRIKIINNKFLFILSKYEMKHSPNNLDLSNKLLLRIKFLYDGPNDELKTEDKIKYHKEKNESLINELKKEINNIIEFNVSNIDNETWVVLENNFDSTINTIMKNKNVECIFSYSGDFDPNDFELKNEEQYEGISIINKIKAFRGSYDTKEGIHFINEEINKKKDISKKEWEFDFVSNISIKKHIFDAKNKLLTIDFKGFNTSNEINELFAYIYNKSKYWEVIKNKIINEIVFLIGKKYEYWMVNKITFGTHFEEATNYDLEIGGFEYNQKVNASIQPSSFLGKDSGFKSQLSIKPALDLMLELKADFFKSFNENKFITKGLALINPDYLEIEEINKVKDSQNSLYVKFKHLDTQLKMDLLFSYLSFEPWNKQEWIHKICELISDKIKEKKLGKISDYSYISFDKDFTNESENKIYYIQKACIASTNKKGWKRELDGYHTKSNSLIYTKDKKFTNITEMRLCIKTNIEWNRTMYKNYNKLHKHLYTYENYIEPTIYTMGKEMWDYFYHLLNYCRVDKHRFISKHNQLRFNWTKLNNLDDINHLFALISTNLNHIDAKLWITKIVHSIWESVVLERKNIENVWYISFNINSEDILLKGASLGGYGPNAEKIDNIDPKQIMNDSWKMKDTESVEKALYYNIKSNEETWAMFNIGQHINNNPLLNHIYRRQFEVIGLMDYFMKETTNTLGFNNKIDTKVAVLESGGLIDYDDHVTYPKMDVNKQSGSKKMHANLVGRICCSNVGVDQHSTIYSSTFDNTTYWTIHKSLEWLIQKGVKIINCSFGLHKFTPRDPDYIEYSNISYKFDYIVRKYGITILKASGNHNTTTGGSYPFFRGNDLAINIINVGSTKADGSSVSLFSNFRKYPNHRLTKESPKPLLVAPGEDYLYTTGTSHNGTSFSTPLVTGMVSILMKEFSQLINNPVCVKAVLAASSNDIYTGQYNTNGLKNRTGSGLADYIYARKACKNLKYKDIENNTPKSTIVLESECFTLNVNDRLYVATATLFNGGYTKLVTKPELWPTRYYLSSAPIIGYIYLSIAYHHNEKVINDFKKFYEEEFDKLKFNKVYDLKNPDNSLLPPDLKVYLKKFDLRTGKWHDVSWTNGSTSTFSNIEKYFYKNVGEAGSFKYEVVLNKEAKHLPFDNTKNKIAATHVIRL